MNGIIRMDPGTGTDQSACYGVTIWAFAAESGPVVPCC